MPALWNNYIRATLRRLDELHVHRANRRQVLLDYGINRSAALGHVAPQAADEADVVRRVHEDLDVHLLKQARVGEDQYPLDDDNRLRLDQQSLVLPRVRLEIVDRKLDRPARPELLDMMYQQLVIERVRVVEVDGVAIIQRQVFQIA